MTRINKLRDKLYRGCLLMRHEVHSLLKDFGYELARIHGSHEQWVKEGRTFTLATHGKDVPHYIVDALQKLLEELDE